MALIPNKWVLLAMAALIVACGYFYLTNRISQSDLRTAQVELNEASKRVETQKTTIDLLQRDAKIQADLMRQYQVSVTDIRKIASDNLAEIADTNYGEQAATNAAELQRTVNQRMQVLLDKISDASRR